MENAKPINFEPTREWCRPYPPWAWFDVAVRGSPNTGDSALSDDASALRHLIQLFHALIQLFNASEVLAPENEVDDTRIRDLVKRFSKYEPFALAQQAQQVYFAEWASKKRDRNDWWVVCKIQARSMTNVPEVAYQEDEICEQYEASIDDEDVNLCGGVGEGDVVEVIEIEVDCMARGKGRGTIARVGRGGRTAVEKDGGSACSRLRKGRSLSQSGGSFNDEIEEMPIEVPVQDGDGGNHVEEYVHQPTSNDHPNNGVPSCTRTQQTDTTQIPQSNTTQTQQTKTKQLRKSPDGRIYVEPYDNSFHPHQAVREIGKIIQEQFGGSWIVWNEVPQEVKDLWFSEFKDTGRGLTRDAKGNARYEEANNGATSS
ncbi:pheromone-processing carboxypeptidase KEX1-like [Senna tora]|uniref:Pheromone-processing carboxypeptidase KEX1-like n=1 Tax=Senna tora TaxID=362788 RepID=A0A834TSB3_9FABA|nr:pheromone-processing carboxypeptidase KEX1-like [Senna tora]